LLSASSFTVRLTLHFARQRTLCLSARRSGAGDCVDSHCPHSALEVSRPVGRWMRGMLHQTRAQKWNQALPGSTRRTRTRTRAGVPRQVPTVKLRQRSTSQPHGRQLATRPFGTNTHSKVSASRHGRQVVAVSVDALRSHAEHRPVLDGLDTFCIDAVDHLEAIFCDALEM